MWISTVAPIAALLLGLPGNDDDQPLVSTMYRKPSDDTARFERSDEMESWTLPFNWPDTGTGRLNIELHKGSFPSWWFYGGERSTQLESEAWSRYMRSVTVTTLEGEHRSVTVPTRPGIRDGCDVLDITIWSSNIDLHLRQGSSGGDGPTWSMPLCPNGFDPLDVAIGEAPTRICTSVDTDDSFAITDEPNGTVRLDLKTTQPENEPPDPKFDPECPLWSQPVGPSRSHGFEATRGSDGRLAILQEYRDELRDGVFVVFYHNGMPAVIGSYREDRADGAWLWLTPEGVPIRAEHRAMGQVIGPLRISILSNVIERPRAARPEP